MARGGLGAGMTALRAALGAAVGGLEGYSRQQELERKRKLEEEAANWQRASMLTSMGFRPTALRTTPDAAAQNVTALETPALPPMAGTPSVMQRSFDRAIQGGMGVTAPVAGSLTAPVQLGGLDTTRTRQFERGAALQPANPEAQINLPGVGRLGFAAPKTDEQKAAEAAALRSQELDQALASLSPEEQARFGPYLRAAKFGVPANVLQVMATPREPKQILQPWAKEGFTSEKEYLEYKKREAGATRAPKGSEDVEPRFGEIASLRKEFNTESRSYKTANDALKVIERLGTKENPSPQDIQAMTYAFVKVQDPNSVVRETEFANAERAIAMADKLGNIAPMLLKGQRLSPTQRADMVQTARELRAEAMARYGALADSYEDLAKGFGMDPKHIVPNRLDADLRKSPMSVLETNVRGRRP